MAPDGRIFLVANAGLESDSRSFKEWMLGLHADRPSFSDLSAMVIDEQRRIWLYTEKTHGYEQVHARCWAIGTGCDYALGAMHAGADAKKAVKIAAKLDVNTGFGVTSVRF
ncbi:MAG: hypothetical protein IPM06_18985 [Rhizobiales bacterium]|nr:hypothetical protein [Hyphomicrobiales bacterium]